MPKIVFSLLFVSCIFFVECQTDIGTALCIAKAKLTTNWNNCAENKMKDNFNKMKSANCLKCDKYFHCMGNYEAVYSCTGSHRTNTARIISDCRDSPDCTDADCKADRQANIYGRNGGNCASRYLCANDYHCSYNPRDGSCKKSNCP